MDGECLLEHLNLCLQSLVLLFFLVQGGFRLFGWNFALFFQC